MYTSAIVILINLIGMIFFFLVFYLVILYNLAINTCSCLNKQTEITKELNNITAPLRGSPICAYPGKWNDKYKYCECSYGTTWNGNTCGIYFLSNNVSVKYFC